MPQADVINLISWPLILTSVPTRDPPSRLVIDNDSLYVGVSESGGTFFIRIIQATSAILCHVRAIDSNVIVSWSFATQQFSRRPLRANERACIWAWVLIIPSSLHFAAVIFSFKDCCQLLSGRLHRAGFSGGGLGADSAGRNRTKKRTEETVETATLVSAEDVFILETLQLGEI